METLIADFFGMADPALQDEGWLLCHESSKGSISRYATPGGWIRLRFLVDSAVDPIDVVPAPEVAAQHPDHASSITSHLHYGKVVSVIEPGHVLVWTSYERNKFMQLRQLLICPSEDPLKRFVGNETLMDSTDWHIGRYVHRRNFPSPGIWCMFVSPEFPEDLKASPPSLWIARRCGEQQHIQVTHLLHEAFMQFDSWNWRYYNMMLDSVSKFCAALWNDPCMVQLRQIGQVFYIVLTMRRSTHGPPLLQDSQDIESWVSYPCTTRFKLPEYLRIFLKRLGMNIDVYSSLDGSQLVPYQAVVRRHDWEKVEALVAIAFQRQMTAYRRLRGCRNVPVLQVDCEPRFLPSLPGPASTGVTQVSDTSDQPIIIHVRNTFINVKPKEQVPWKRHWSL